MIELKLHNGTIIKCYYVKDNQIACHLSNKDIIFFDHKTTFITALDRLAEKAKEIEDEG